MLNDITFKAIYDSADSSIVKDLLVPALSNSFEYWRGVGYFASGWLQLTAEGIEKIAEKGGKIRFIVSPMLSSQDMNAFSLAEQAKNDEVLRTSLRKNIDEIAAHLHKDVLNVFAWLLADDIIEFKFAVPKKNTEGDYHDKVGVCIDEQSNILAFHGSFNDTYKGSLNGEAFSVFQSWIPGQDVYSTEHLRRLQNLWNNGNSQFNVIPFEEALRKDFIGLRTDSRPYKLPQENIVEPKNISGPRIPYTLKSYQEEAIAAWFENDCSGIFEMATGTGKTITSTAAAVKLFQKKARLFLVIIVPFTHLLEQWKENCKKFGIDIVACYGENPKWRKEFNSLIMQFKIGSSPIACAIVVQNTACSEDFIKLTQKIPSADFMMIADETHYLGARNYQKALFSTAKYRLGLSATPDRWMDEDGSGILYGYYGKTVYTISLDDAIEGGFLTKYLYNPVFVELTDEETEEYGSISKEIGRLFSLMSSGKIDRNDEERLEKLRLKRARLLARAENKTVKYIELLTKLADDAKHEKLKDLLIFCADGTHRDILRLTNNQGIKTHEFVHEVDIKSRQQVLDAFAKGDIEAVVSMKCMDEGVDVPSTRTAIFLASTTNPKQFIQRRGRVLRKYDQKEYAVIYDFIVVPQSGTAKDIACSILRRELPRFAEFAESADNKYCARELFWNILEEFNMHMYIDMKPWEIYKQNLKDGDDSYGEF